MLKHLPADALKTIKKTLLCSKKAVYYHDVNTERRVHNGTGINTTGINATQIATAKGDYAMDLNIDPNCYGQRRLCYGFKYRW